MNRYALRLSMINEDGTKGRELVLCFTTRSGIGRDELISAIRKSSIEFCKTEEGRAIFEENGCKWSYIDFARNVSNDVCKRHGIEKVDGHGYSTCILVAKDVFPQEQSLVSEEDLGEPLEREYE